MTEHEVNKGASLPSTDNDNSVKDHQKLMAALILGLLIFWGIKSPDTFRRVIMVALGFGGIVMIHEFGHFIAAKLGGIKVEAFSIGMGPVVMGIRKLKKGWKIRLFPKIGEEPQVEEGDNDTEYQIAMLPIGGFVKMLGQSDTGAADASNDPRSYANRPVWIRLCVVSAGVIFNAVSALILFIALYMNGIELPAGIVGDVKKNSPAQVAGIKPGDEIIEVNGKSYVVNGDRCVDFETVFQADLLSSGELVTYVVKHQDDTMEEIQLIPEKPAGDERNLRFSGISKGHTLEINPAIKEPNSVDKLFNATQFRPGDVVKAINGQAVMDPWQYQELISKTFTPEVELRVSRQWPPDPDSKERTIESVKLPMWFTPTVDNFRDQYDLAHFGTLVPRLKVGDDGKSAEVQSRMTKIVSWIRKTIFRQDPSSIENQMPLVTGDIIIRIADVDFPNYQQLRELTVEYEDKDMPVTVLRQDTQGIEQKIELILKPQKRPGSDRVTVGFAPVLDLEHPVVAQTITVPDQVAITSEITPGSVITAVDGEPVNNFFEIASLLQKNAGHKVSIEYISEGQTGGAAITVSEHEPIHAQSQVALVIPFSELTHTFVASNPLDAVKMGTKKVSQFITGNYATLGQLFKKDGVPVSALSGPVGIISMTYQVTEASVDRYLYFLGLISACLAVMNLLPLPVLDGGHIVLLIIEKITGKPVHEKILAPVMYIGLALILGLVLMVTYNDLIRIFFG